ncbi:MAG: hypothetical protein ACPIOQ_58380, partial [Promethearchaeia archaeon]
MAGTSAQEMVPSPSAVMHDKIRKAQEVRRARLRTRLEEMTVSGAPAPHASDEARPPPESALVPERRALRASPKSPKVAFALSQDGASDAITPYAADAIGHAPTTRSAPAAAAEEEGKPPWAGLRLEIASPPAAKALRARASGQARHPQASWLPTHHALQPSACTSVTPSLGTQLLSCMPRPSRRSARRLRLGKDRRQQTPALPPLSQASRSSASTSMACSSRCEHRAG